MLFFRDLQIIIIQVCTVIMLGGCQQGNRIIHHEVDLQNALRVNMAISTSQPCQLFISYRIAGADGYQNTGTTERSVSHSIDLFKLKPATAYQYSIHDNERELLKDTFTTAELPESLPSVTLIKSNEDIFDGFILMRKVQDPGQQFMIDQRGDIVWYQQFDTTVFRPFSLTPDTTIIALKNADQIHEFRLNGDKVFNLSLGQKGFTSPLHHEIIKNSKGEILSLTRNNQVFDLRAVGGAENDTIKGDGIVLLDPDGHKLWEWDIFQFSNPLEYENIPDSKDDWSHANSLSIDTDGHYLVSFRHFNQVWKIHSVTGEIIWRMGMNGDFDLSNDQVFYLQHTAHINPFGELMLFDNGAPERRTSRAVSFIVDPGGSVRIGKVNVFLPPELFSFKQGSAYVIENDKILFCSSIKNQLVITDLRGNILWQAKLSESVYRAEYVKSIEW